MRLKKITVYFLAVFSLFYISLMLFSVCDLINQNQKLILGTMLDDWILKEYLTKDRDKEIFQIKERKHIILQIKNIIVEMFIFILIIGMNITFYFDRSRDIVFNHTKKFISLMTKLEFINANEDLAVLMVHSLLFIFISIIFGSSLLTDVYGCILMVFIFAILVYFRSYLFHDYFKEIPRKFLILLFLASNVSLFFLNIYSIHFYFKEFKGIIPAFLRDDGLRLAKNFFGKENIYYVRNDSLNMMTSNLFLTTVLIIIGSNWAAFAQDEMAGIIGHEISHGGAMEKYVKFFTISFLNFSSLVIYIELMNLYSKNIKTRLKNDKIRMFLFYLNSYVLILTYQFFSNFYIQQDEYFADRYSKVIAPGGNIKDALFKMYTYTDDIFYMPKFYNYFKNNHPSFYHRIEALKDQ